MPTKSAVSHLLDSGFSLEGDSSLFALKATASAKAAFTEY
jgi:hypothetical protein